MEKEEKKILLIDFVNQIKERHLLSHTEGMRLVEDYLRENCEVSDSLLSAKEARESAIQHLQQKLHQHPETTVAMLQIREKVKEGEMSCGVLYDPITRFNLKSLGFRCGLGYEAWGDVYMQVDWKEEGKV